MQSELLVLIRQLIPRELRILLFLMCVIGFGALFGFGGYCVKYIGLSALKYFAAPGTAIVGWQFALEIMPHSAALAGLLIGSWECRHTLQ